MGVRYIFIAFIPVHVYYYCFVTVVTLYCFLLCRRRYDHVDSVDEGLSILVMLQYH